MKIETMMESLLTSFLVRIGGRTIYFFNEKRRLVLDISSHFLSISFREILLQGPEFILPCRTKTQFSGKKMFVFHTVRLVKKYYNFSTSFHQQQKAKNAAAVRLKKCI